MKIAAIGGTGLIGSQVVKILNASGHEAVPLSPSTGVDLLSGQGLTEALAGAGVVVNLTNSPTFDDASPAFFEKTMDNLLAAAEAAGAGHAVILSIVGADLVPGLVYYRAKVRQEDILKSGPVPYSIVRATQFFEFIDAVLSWTADENTVRLPATLVQPMAAADVAQAVADVCAGAPLQGTRDIAGPEEFGVSNGHNQAASPSLGTKVGTRWAAWLASEPHWSSGLTRDTLAVGMRSGRIEERCQTRCPNAKRAAQSQIPCAAPPPRPAPSSRRSTSCARPSAADHYETERQNS